MPFRYEFYIDNEKLNGVEMGFSTSRKWEEALDEARLVVPFSYLNNTPYKMYSLLTIKIGQFETYAQTLPTDEKIYHYLVYSDHVEAVGVYGYYKHTVLGIEYTAKLDAQIVSQLAKSRNVINNSQAPFITNDEINKANTLGRYIIYATLQNINVKSTLKSNTNIVFPQVYQPYIQTETTPYYRRGVAMIRTNAPLISGTSPHILSSSSATWVFPKGQWEIEYGYIALSGDYAGGLGFQWVYKFYVNIIDQYELSIYDVLQELRSCVSKFGGIEDTVYYDSTRIFDIDPIYETYLKSVQAPQTYLSKTSARRMASYVLAFVSSLPRLIKEQEGNDTLSIETYNLSQGIFSKADLIGQSAVQNTSQIGTRNYQHITQSLANDLDEPSVYGPSQGGFQQVRSASIQLTADNFVYKLPEQYPMYMPTKFVVLIPKVKVVEVLDLATVYEESNFELDLTSRFINGEEWKLKLLTDNFPSIQTTNVWDSKLGLRKYMVDNLSWNVGDTEIKLALIYGTVFQSNLFNNVVKESIYEYFVLNPPIPYFDDDGEIRSLYEIQITAPTSSQYKDWKIRIEYITDERLVIKQDKEDLSQISFYSEMQQNQEEALVNILRQSRKGYGDLQRTGNVEFSFPKVHKSFNDFYEIGQTDSENYTITQIDTQWFNEHAIAVYHLTKYHNRIQQATYVNQKYRPFDNFAKSVLYRHENYTDYLIALPPNDEDVILPTQLTKIYSNGNTIYRIIEMMLGLQVNNTNKKASVALVRTDGMFDVYSDSDFGQINRNFILSPVTAKGIKGGFAFTFGFQGNQSAGDGLVMKEVGGVKTWYNQAVRYTDRLGRFSRFGFLILRDYELDSNDYETYPLVTVDYNIITAKITNDAYFWCGYPQSNLPYEYPLVWNKDPLTNANLTYQLSVISYYTGLYIFGVDFFSKNYIVNNPEISEDVYLYLYSNGTTYSMFEDIYVKSGYLTPIRINNINIQFVESSNWLRFVGIDLTGKTSWAIGRPQDDGTIKLLLACNENHNGIQFFKQHFRPNVYEIGYVTPTVEPPSTYTILLTDTLNVFSGISEYRSTDYGISLDDTLDLESNIGIIKFEFPVISFSDMTFIVSGINPVKSTNSIISSLIDNIDINSVSSQTQSEDYVININDYIDIVSGVNAVKSTDYITSLNDSFDVEAVYTIIPFEFPIINLEDSIGVNSSIVITGPPTNWLYLGSTTQAYDYAVTFVGTGSDCGTSTTIDTWLTSNYPPSNYGKFDVMRVRRESEEALCSPVYYYYEAR